MRAYNTALRSLNMNACSQARMRQKLLKQGHNAEVVETVVDKLKEQGFLNDAEYALSVARHEMLVKCRSKKLALLKLRALEFDAEVIEDALNGVDEAEAMRMQAEFVDAAIESSLYALKSVDAEVNSEAFWKAYQKVAARMSRRGIALDLVRSRWRERTDS
jgi:regulatory protein